jgi:hypothetical protein
MSKMQTFELLAQVSKLSRFDPFDDVELEAVYSEMDIDNDGEIGFDEFFGWWRDNRRKLESKSVCKGNRKLLWSIFKVSHPHLILTLSPAIRHPIVT